MASRVRPKPARDARPRQRHPEYVGGKLIVRFKEDALRPAIAAAARGARMLRGVLPEQVEAPLAMLRNEVGVERIDPLLAPPPKPAGAQGLTRLTRGVLSLAASVESSPRERLRGYNLIELECKHVPDDMLRRIRASRAVEFVERMPNRWIFAGAADPSLNLQWGLRAIGWFSVRRPDAAKVHVAVLDTGVDRSHPDLAGAVEAYHRNGHSARDLPGHGTHVCGIIAARANNGIGISGVANCRLHVWKVFTDPARRGAAEKFDDEGYLRSLGEVLDSPARIVNLSLGGTASSRTEQDLMAALASEGALVVAAMGNAYEEGNPTEYPAAYADVLAVGAIGENRRRASFSSTGRHIGLVAPGNNFLSTVPTYPYVGRETDYEAWPGTSMAAPHVAGCAALVKARNAGRDGRWIAARLQRGAVKLPAMNGQAFTSAYGHGLVHLVRAL